MTALDRTDKIFFDKAGLDLSRVEGIAADALAHSDDGELFLEYSQSESLAWDDGRLKSASFDTSQGFGLRAVAGESTAYAHASSLDEAAIPRAAETVQAVRAGHSGQWAAGPIATNRKLYGDDNPIEEVPFAERSTKMFPQFSADLAKAMKEETDRFIEAVFFESDLRVTVQQIGVWDKGLFERSDDVFSVAYWYQSGPRPEAPAFPDAAARVPR